jgi:uncharacterized protein YoxC
MERGRTASAFGRRPVPDRRTSLADLTRSVAEIPRSVSDLGRSVTEVPLFVSDLRPSVSDLRKSVFDSIKFVSDRAKSVSDLIKSVSDLTKSVSDLVQSATDRGTSLCNFSHFARDVPTDSLISSGLRRSGSMAARRKGPSRPDGRISQPRPADLFRQGEMRSTASDSCLRG